MSKPIEIVRLGGLNALRSTESEKSSWVMVSVPKRIPASIGAQIPSHFISPQKAENYLEEMRFHTQSLKDSMETDTLEYQALPTELLAESIRKSANAIRITRTKKDIVAKALMLHRREKGIKTSQEAPIPPDIKEQLRKMNGRINYLEKLLADVQKSMATREKKARMARHQLSERMNLIRNFVGRLAYTLNPSLTKHMPWIEEKVRTYEVYGRDL